MSSPFRRLLVPALLTTSLAFAAGPSTFAQGAKTSAPADADIDALKPGQFIWQPQVAPEGPMVVVVDLGKQMAYVYRNGVRIGASTVSSGKKGHETPTGVFTILQKDADHRSNKYNNAAMPYMERLTWDGVALHAGGLPGYPSSHGCVHLPLAFAKQLFSETKTGMTVIVVDQESRAPHLESTAVLSPYDAKSGDRLPAEEGLAEGQSYRWRPDVSPSGPVTIIISGADKRVIVSRNGKEIGRARLQITGTGELGAHALVLMQGSQPGENPFVPGQPNPNWMHLDLPGQSKAVAGTPPDQAIISRLGVSEDFSKLVFGVLKPGATVFVTDDPILPATTGKSVKVLDVAKD